MEAGNARLGMTVADRFRRNRKMTITTSPTVRSSVNLTSWTDARIDTERSLRTSSVIDGGNCARKVGISSLIASTTATTLVPGCFRTAR